MPGKFGSGSTVSEVMSGRADADLVDDSMAQQIKRNDGWARIIAPPRFVPLTDIAWAVPKGDADSRSAGSGGRCGALSGQGPRPRQGGGGNG